jgi:hypothetical protein
MSCERSGYFTSRAALKRNVRDHEGYLQAARALDVLQGQSPCMLSRLSCHVL